MEQEKTREKKDEKEMIVVKILMKGKKAQITVPKGTRLKDALKQADILQNLSGLVVRINGENIDIEKEDPILNQDSLVSLAQKIKGGV